MSTSANTNTNTQTASGFTGFTDFNRQISFRFGEEVHEAIEA
jgi:hypothetical protein